MTAQPADPTRETHELRGPAIDLTGDESAPIRYSDRTAPLVAAIAASDIGFADRARLYAALQRADRYDAATLNGPTTAGRLDEYPGDAGTFAARWNMLTPEDRDEVVRGFTRNMHTAAACFQQDHAGHILHLQSRSDATDIRLLRGVADMIHAKDHRLDLGDDPHSAGWRHALDEVEHEVRHAADIIENPAAHA